jgi:hypothetical protein
MPDLEVHIDDLTFSLNALEQTVEILVHDCYDGRRTYHHSLMKMLTGSPAEAGAEPLAYAALRQGADAQKYSFKLLAMSYHVLMSSLLEAIEIFKKNIEGPAEAFKNAAKQSRKFLNSADEHAKELILGPYENLAADVDWLQESFLAIPDLHNEIPEDEQFALAGAKEAYDGLLVMLEHFQAETLEVMGSMEKFVEEVTPEIEQ